MDESWLLRFAVILLAYSTLGLPAYLVIRYVKKRHANPGADDRRRNCLYDFLVRFSVGLDRESYLPVATDEEPAAADEPPESAPPVPGERKQFLKNCATFAVCFLGIQGTLIVMGLYQERLMTQGYRKTSTEGTTVLEKFGDTQFLMLMNRLFSMVIYGAYIFYNHRRQPPHVPPYYVHSFTSLSNTMSSWCQYEALKYVSFPIQTICKASKIIPTMIMGRLLRKERYSMVDYLCAFALAGGASIFFLASSNGHKSAPGAAADYSWVSGIILMVMYLSFDAFTPNWQKSLFDTKPKISKYQMIFGTSLFSAILCVVSLAEQATLFSSFEFFLNHEGFMQDVFLLSLSGAVSQMFIYTTIQKFGPIIFTIIMTVRQILSIIISTLYFGHGMTWIGIVGFVIVFASIFAGHCLKYQKKKAGASR
uniref:Adenosine 3'-phospho 5'-phosphosulfate transporter 1 n=1 Tax=Steinernema glaseri TaxID=37863 RepID=A0A1I7YYK0_9BILA